MSAPEDKFSFSPQNCALFILVSFLRVCHTFVALRCLEWSQSDYKNAIPHLMRLLLKLPNGVNGGDIIGNEI